MTPREQWRVILRLAGILGADLGVPNHLVNDDVKEILRRLSELDEDRLETTRDLVFSQSALAVPIRELQDGWRSC